MKTLSLRIALKIFSILAVSSLLVGLTACPNESPSITATDSPNQTGGQLQITGSGFTAGNPVSVGILNVPGASTWTQAAGNADGSGNINVTVAYSYGPGSTLPGCQVGNNTTTSLNVTATDSKTHTLATTTATVAECGWATPQVSQHQ